MESMCRCQLIRLSVPGSHPLGVTNIDAMKLPTESYQGFPVFYNGGVLPHLIQGVRRNYYVFIKCNIKLVKFQGKRAVALHHTAKTTYLMSETIV